MNAAGSEVEQRFAMVFGDDLDKVAARRDVHHHIVIGASCATRARR